VDDATLIVPASNHFTIPDELAHIAAQQHGHTLITKA